MCLMYYPVRKTLWYWMSADNNEFIFRQYCMSVLIGSKTRIPISIIIWIVLVDRKLQSRENIFFRFYHGVPYIFCKNISQRRER